MGTKPLEELHLFFFFTDERMMLEWILQKLKLKG